MGEDGAVKKDKRGRRAFEREGEGKEVQGTRRGGGVKGAQRRRGEGMMA